MPWQSFSWRLWLWALLVLCGLTASGCKDRFEQGQVAGYQSGFQSGLAEGRQESTAEAQKEGYRRGLDEGRKAGIKAGKDEGYKEGRAQGFEEGKEKGRAEVQTAALEQGRTEGIVKGRTEGEAAGFKTGRQKGYKAGYQVGEKEGRRREMIALMKDRAWRLGAPIVLAALFIGILFNLLGWRTISHFSDLATNLGRELELKKEWSSQSLKVSHRRRQSALIAAPDVWFIVIALLSFMLIEYKMAEEIGIFMAMLAISLLGAVYAIKSSQVLVARVSFFWIAAAALVFDTRYAASTQWIREPAATALVITAAYFLARALFGVGWNRPFLDSAGKWEAFFIVVASIGATLQIAWLLTFLTKFIAPDLLSASAIGRTFAGVLKSVRSVSPASWLPAGLSGLALLLASALRMSRDRFNPIPFDDVPPHPENATLAALIIVPKLPVWLLFNIFGFLLHYVRQAWETIIHFAENYLSRLVYLTVALFVPIVCVLGGHTLLQSSSVTIANYLGARVAVSLPSLVWVMFSVLMASTLYLLAMAALPFEIKPVPFREVGAGIKTMILQDSKPAVSLVLVVYSIFFGLVIMSLSFVWLLPGARPSGFFSWLCAGIVGTVMLVSVIIFAKSARRRRMALDNVLIHSGEEPRTATLGDS